MYVSINAHACSFILYFIYQISSFLCILSNGSFMSAHGVLAL